VKVDDAKPSGSNQPLSASSRKLQVDLDKTDKKPKLKEQMPEVSGYRLVDLKSLVSAFELVCCQECGQQTVTLRELSFRRKGCASCLQLFCTSCGWNEAFYTSKKKKKFFDVNRRLVYGMRVIGRGASAAKRFCTIMNMPPPPAPNAYSRHNKALMEAAKKVAVESMEAAATFHDLYFNRCNNTL